MITTISVFLVIRINFLVPSLSKNKKYTRINSFLNLGFPYQYFKGKVLTNEMKNDRIQAIFLIFYIYLVLISTSIDANPTPTKIFTTSRPAIERLTIENTYNNQILLLHMRDGQNSNLIELLIKILWIWATSQKGKPVEGFQPKPKFLNNHNFQHANTRVTPTLNEKSFNKNKSEAKNCKLDNNASMDQLCNFLNPEYSKFFTIVNIGVESFK